MPPRDKRSAALLERAKNAFRSLSQADRAVFLDFAAKHNGRAVSSGEVVLRGGTGKRAKLNGISARMVDGSQRNSWVDVTLLSGHRVPWRVNAWDAGSDSGPPDLPSIVCLDLDPTCLPPNVVCTILNFLPLPSRLRAVCVCRSWAECSRNPLAWTVIRTPLVAWYVSGRAGEPASRRAGVCTGAYAVTEQRCR